MTTAQKQKPNDHIPYGLVATKSWLLAQGVSRHTLDNWVKSEKLSVIVPGVYKIPNTPLTWEGIISSLQRMGSDLCPGGITTLTIEGLGHYLTLGPQKTIHLYGQDRPPLWLNKVLPDVTFVHHATKKLWGALEQVENPLQEFTVEISSDLAFGTWPMRLSSTEKAWFEVLLDVPDTISFEHADQLMQGLVNLAPQRLSKLLVLCQNVKVRRLFLWFAERHQHAWLNRLERTQFTMESGLLGSGKRVLTEGGKLDPQYWITVPAEMVKEAQDG